jgi:hypothetical protein
MKRYSTEVVGNAFTMLGRRNADGGGAPPASQPSNDDDLPF